MMFNGHRLALIPTWLTFGGTLRRPMEPRPGRRVTALCKFKLINHLTLHVTGFLEINNLQFNNGRPRESLKLQP